MRKLLFVLAIIAIVAVSCQKESNEVVDYTPSSESATDDYCTIRSYDEALLIAEDAVSRVDTRSVSRSVKSYEYYVAKPATRSQADTIEVAFHLINYDNNAGYALVSADKRTTDVYMYSDVGQLSAEDFETKEGLSIFKDAAIEYFQAEIRGEMPLAIPSATPITPIEKPDILNLPLEYYNGDYYYCKTEQRFISQSPMITCYWHQAYPYNTINGVQFGNYTGCGINSIGQIMSYYKYPPTYGTSVYDWDLMTANSSHIWANDATNMIAQLMYDIGAFLDVTYGDDGTSTTISESRRALLEYGYTVGNAQSFSTMNVIYELDAGRPVWIRGADVNNVGHAWVIDAYYGTMTTKTYYHRLSPYPIYATVRLPSVEFRSVWGDANTPYSYTIPYDFSGQNYDVYVMLNIKPNN